MLQARLRWIFSALLLIGLSGCGQSGPLYLPKEEPVKTSPPAPTTAPAPAADSATPSN